MSLKKRDIREYKTKIQNELGNNTFSITDLEQQDKILFGTFGYHDSEPPHSIIHRKVREVNDNEFGLWGTSISKEGFDQVIQFCKRIDGDVYVFLKFTGSTGQKKRDDPDKEIWSVKKVMESRDYYSAYEDENGNKCDLNPKKTHIIVKGNERQNVAFVVRKYYFYKNEFSRKGLLSCYKGTLYNGRERKSGEKLFTKCPCYLLERKSQSHLMEHKGNDCEWAIVLELKAPYLVRCIKDN